MNKVKKAIILAGGYGTRMLPITKSVPKELLPIVDTPVMDFLVEECINSGIEELTIVLSKGKEAIIHNYLNDYELDNELKKKNKYDLLKVINRFNDRIKINYVYQNKMNGTANALKLCENFIHNEPFALLYADEIYCGDKPVIKQLIDAYNTTSKTIIAVSEFPESIAKDYNKIKKGSQKGRYTQILGIIEKSETQNSEHILSGVGRFVLNDSIFNYIEENKTERNGEYYLTDAINLMAINEGVFGYNYEGERYDIGNKLGYIKAIIDFALKDNTIKEGVKTYIKKSLE